MSHYERFYICFHTNKGTAGFSVSSQGMQLTVEQDVVVGIWLYTQASSNNDFKLRKSSNSQRENEKKSMFGVTGQQSSLGGHTGGTLQTTEKPQ